MHSSLTSHVIDNKGNLAVGRLHRGVMLLLRPRIVRMFRGVGLPKHGEVPERLNGPVSKTGEPSGSVGSNPTLSGRMTHRPTVAPAADTFCPSGPK